MRRESPHAAAAGAAMRSRRKPRSFYGFILSNNINQSSFKIPKEITKYHRKQILLNDVVLIVPDGLTWSMGWMVSGDGNLWLHKRWPEFAEHYRLKSGQQLHFTQLSDLTFHVTIFGLNCCEIEYPPPPSVDHKRQALTMVKTEDETEEPSRFQEIKVSNDTASEMGKAQGSRNRALEASKCFKSDNPFYSVKMNAAYLQSWGLYVPVGFFRKYLSSGTTCMLQVSDGRNWGPVKCRDYKTYGKLFGKIWKKFLQENHLGVGDVCVVELMNQIEKVLKVTIFRAFC